MSEVQGKTHAGVCLSQKLNYYDQKLSRLQTVGKYITVSWFVFNDASTVQNSVRVRRCGLKKIPSWVYTQTKKKRPIFMVLCLSIQLRCCNKNKTKMFIKRPTHKKW